MADVRRFDPGQKRDPDGTWGDGVPGSGLTGFDLDGFDLIADIDGTFGNAIMGVDSAGDVRLAFREGNDNRELDLSGDEFRDLADALQWIVDARDGLADDAATGEVQDERGFGEAHKVELYGNGVISIIFGADDPDPWTLNLDPPSEEDDDADLFLGAMDDVFTELDAVRSRRHSMRAWTATDEVKHPRGKGGRFRSNVDKLKHAIETHRTSGSKGDPFAGFDREQLRRVAKTRNIALSRGEGRESIAKKLIDDLDGGAPKLEPKPVKPKAEPKPRKPRVAKAAPRKPEPVPGPEAPKGAYTGPLYKYASPETERVAGEMSDFKAKVLLGTATDADWAASWAREDAEGNLDDVTRRRVGQEAYIKSNFERFRQTKASGTSAEDLKADMQRRSEKAWAGKPIAVRVTPSSLAKILSDGRFKTQFETNASSALLDIDRRADVEARWFGIPRVGADPTTRPIYGYVAVEGERPTADFGYLNQYGEVQVVLKDNVRDRTTAMWGDSLNVDEFGWPEPIDSPTWMSYTASPRSIGSGELEHLHREVGSNAWLEHNFVEAQIHGGVGVSDIAEVVLGEQPKPALQKALEAAGIPWRVL